MHIIYLCTLLIFFLGTKLQKQIPTATSAAIYKKSYKKLIILSYKLRKTLTYYAHQQQTVNIPPTEFIIKIVIIWN